MDITWLEYQIPEVDSPCSAPLLAQMQDGDELLMFSRPLETSNEQGGDAGIALVRGGMIVAHVVIFDN